MNSPSSEFTITGDTEIRAIFKKVQYQVEVNASPSDYGITDELSETFSYGESVTLTATPLTGKQFDQWAEIENLSLNNSEDRYKETATFQILGNAKVQANFSRIPINVGVEFVSLDQNDQPFPEDIGGTINMPSSIYHGDFVTLDLNLFAGYNLLNWVDLDTGLNISSQDSISFTAVSDRNFKVVLRKLHYQLEVDQTGQGEASINMSPPYYWKDEIEISAVPDDHWEFFRWTGTGSENLDDIYSPSAVLSIEKNSDLLAEFREKEYYLNVFETPDGYGSLTDTESSYNFGDSVTIQATPRKGKLFDKWLIDGNVSFSQNTDSLSNPATFNVHGSSNIRANFVSKIYSVVYQVLVIDENGVTQEKINGARIRGGTTFEDEEIAEFNISLNDGYKLLHWQIEKENPEIKSTDSVYRHQMLGDLNLTAVVTDRKYNVGVELSPASGGVVTLNDIDNNLSQSGFSYGENIRITATPSSGYRFVKWSATGTIFSSPDLRNQDFSISNDVKLTAHFAPTGEINLTLLSSPSGAASEMLGGGSFYYDPEHAILTAPKPGYLFSHWEYNGSIAEGVVRDANSSNTSLTLDGDKVLTAVFKDDDNFDPQEDSSIYLLSVYSNNANEGTTVGSGFFRGTRTIKAFPKSGFIFSHWEGDTPFDPHSPITEISVLANTSVVAHFKSTAVIAEPDEPDEELFQLIVSSNNLNHGTTKGSGFFPKSVRTIEAIPNTGYEFSHWEGSTFANEYSPITDIDVFAYTKVVAHFQSIGLFDDSEALENGWWVNPWFGYFWKVGEDDWLFHEKLGWIFLKKQGDSSIWIWIQKMNGWFWTAKDHYPYLHSESSHSWYWLNLEKSDFNGLVIYDYANAKWFSF